MPVNGRLDQQRYRYALWRPNPLSSTEGTVDEALVELARRFFSWVGPATAGEFRWFSGLPVKRVRTILDQVRLEPAEPESDRLLPAEDLPAFRAFQPPSRPRYALVSSLDSISAARRDVRTLLEAQDLEKTARLAERVGTMGGLNDLPSHAILDRGRLIGLWEYDPDARSVVWASFVPRDKALIDAVKETERFVREELGDARAFSLDSPRSRVPRFEALQAMS